MRSVFDFFPGRVAVSPNEVGEAVFGWSAQTVYNRINTKTFPLPLVKIGGAQVVPLAALAKLLGEDPPPSAAPPKQLTNGPSRRKRGRPRKDATREGGV